MTAGNALTDLLAKSSQRDDKLRQNFQIQRYFDDYRELMAREVMAKISSPVSPARKHSCRGKKRRFLLFFKINILLFRRKFHLAGKDMVENGHFMSTKILENILVLNSRMEKMIECWDLREEIYT